MYRKLTYKKYIVVIHVRKKSTKRSFNTENAKIHRAVPFVRIKSEDFSVGNTWGEFKKMKFFLLEVYSIDEQPSGRYAVEEGVTSCLIPRFEWQSAQKLSRTSLNINRLSQL